jgi:hypothetical protein
VYSRQSDFSRLNLGGIVIGQTLLNVTLFYTS